METVMLFLCSASLFVCIMLLIMSIVCPDYDTRGNLIMCGVVGIFLTILLGFGLFCSVITYSKKETCINPDYVFTTPYLIICTYEDIVVTKPNNKNTVNVKYLIKKIENFNAYGTKSEEPINYSIVEIKNG